MENLIAKSYEIDTRSYFLLASGEKVSRYKIVYVKIETDNEIIHYDIYRSAMPQEAHGHISSRRVSHLGYEGKSYWKIYYDNDKFERAIKRIEKLIK
jgi:hypothetical protein